MAGTRKGAITRKRTAVKCSGCGKEFEATRSDTKWCPDCRVWATRDKLRRYETAKQHPCMDCGALCNRKGLRCRACDNKQRIGNQSGASNNSWKGGRHLNKASGYVEILIAPYTRVLEHRHVWEQAYGPIPEGWHVHHLNGIKSDNRLENLVAMSKSDHHRNHHEPWERRIQQLEARIRELVEVVAL